MGAWVVVIVVVWVRDEVLTWIMRIYTVKQCYDIFDEWKKYLSSYPDLVQEWHTTKNGNLTPKDLTHEIRKRYGGYVLKVIVFNRLLKTEH